MLFAVTWMELETLVLSKVSQKERQRPYEITYIWNLIYGTNFSIEKKIMDLENRLVVAKGEVKGGGWIGSLELICANYCLWNGLAMRSCCGALGTMSSHLMMEHDNVKK